MKYAVRLFILLLLTSSAIASDSRTVLVTDVVDGHTLIIDQPVNGTRQVRLVGIEAPRLPLGRPGFPTWPLAHASREVLETLALGRRVRLEWGEHAQDRYGRLLAHVFRDDGAWLQAEMLRRGFARVHTFPDNSVLVEDMLAIEADAREAELGIWSHPFYAVRTPDSVERDLDSFQVVEGRVVEAKRVKRHTYLNFGEDWRTDFTVAIPTKLLRRFETKGVVPLSLSGRVVRVRGWIESFNGPLINATHPEQIEVIDERPMSGH